MRDEVRIKADLLLEGVAHRKCPHCLEIKPMDDFGIRRMAVKEKHLKTNQSWCRKCRSIP